MKIQINGAAHEIPDGLSVAGLIAHQKIKQPAMVSVEHNGEILDREEFGNVPVKEGDAVEFLYFMGGGA